MQLVDAFTRILSDALQALPEQLSYVSASAHTTLCYESFLSVQNQTEYKPVYVPLLMHRLTPRRTLPRSRLQQLPT